MKFYEDIYNGANKFYFKNIQRGITQKLRKGEQSFLCRTLKW